MNVKKLKIAFEEGALTKAEYIREMGGAHQSLFNYVQLIQNTDIQSIQVDQSGVQVCFEHPPIRLSIPKGEVRAAPVEAINFGSYEKKEFEVVESILRQLPVENPLMIDVGGNVGFYSIGLEKLFPNLTIHAFEPVPATAEQFQLNCQLNECHDITLHRVALSRDEGEAVFHVHPAMSVAASMQNILDAEEAVEVRCPMKRLDDFAAELSQPIDFLKCDVEGAELMVFEGGREALRKDKPVVFSEMLRRWSARFGYHPNDIIKLFSEIGYHCFALSDTGCSAIEAVTEETLETNYIFLHKEKHEGIRLHS